MALKKIKCKDIEKFEIPSFDVMGKAKHSETLSDEQLFKMFFEDFSKQCLRVEKYQTFYMAVPWVWHPKLNHLVYLSEGAEKMLCAKLDELGYSGRYGVYGDVFYLEWSRKKTSAFRRWFRALFRIFYGR